MRAYERKSTTPFRSALLWRTAAAWLVATALATGAALAADGTAAADETATGGKASRITLNYPRAPLSRVLDRIERAAGGINIKISVEDEADETKYEEMPVSVDLDNVTWRTAIAYLSKKYGFVPNFTMEQEGVILLERPHRIRMNVPSAPIENVIQLIASDAGVNVIIGPEVKGTVSFSIHDVPWRDALDSILKTHGYVAVEDASGVIRITTPEKEQEQHQVKIFQLRYISPEKTRYSTKLSSEYIDWAADSADSKSFDLLSVLTGLVGSDGSVTFERRTNQVVVRSTASKIAEVEKVIRDIDRAPNQIQLKVRILTIKKEGGSTIGLNWANGLKASVSGGSWQTTFPFNSESYGREARWRWGHLGPLSAVAIDTDADRGEPIPANWITPKPTGVQRTEASFPNYETNYAFGRMSFEELVATLQLVQTDQSIDLVQAPELVVLDNQEATIHIGEVKRYAEWYSTIVEGATESGYRAGPEVPLGVQLLVVPHVIPDTDKVVMTIIPKTEDLDEIITYGAGTGNEVILPQTSTKTVATRMMLANMETGIIAGLMTKQNSETQQKVPYLGDVPLIGKMFRSTNKTSDRTNVAILITPAIIRPEHTETFETELTQLRNQVAQFE